MYQISEDAAFVAHVKDNFGVHKESDGYDWRYSFQEFSLMSTFMNNLEGPSTITTEKVIEDRNVIHAVSTKGCNLISSQMMHTDTLVNATESEFSQQPLNTTCVAEQLSSEDYKPFITENDILKFRHEEELKTSPYRDNFDRRIYGNLINELMDFHFEEGAAESNFPTFAGNEFESFISKSGWNFSSSHGDYELQKALGTAIEDNTFQYTYGASISGNNVACHTIGDTDVSGLESVGFPMKEVEVEQVSEAVAANASSSFDDNSSNMSSRNHVAYSKRHDQSKHSASLEDDKVPWSFLSSEFLVPGMNTSSSLSASLSSAESKISSLSDKQQQRKGSDSLNPVKLSRLSTTNKRRARYGDNQKTRPRDRQLIQDRIKELRELVPDSEKVNTIRICNIYQFFLSSIFSSND